MQTKKLLLLFALVLCVVLSLVACTDDKITVVPENVNVTVTFDSRGGSEVAPIEVASGATITLPANPTKANHTFDGWFLDEAATNVFDASGAVSGNVTVYAKWTEDAKYAVTFVGGEGATGTAPVIASQYAGAEFNLPANTFTKANYTFDGWLLGEDTYQPNEEFTITAAAVTFTAKWTEHAKYAVTFAGGEGAIGTAPIIASQYAGAEFNLPANTFTKANYTFAGWLLGEDTYQPNEEFTITAAPVTFTAKWTENAKYAVTFAGGEGATGTAPIVANQYAGASITLPANPFEKGQYVFGGWTDGTSTYNVGANYVVGAAVVSFEPVWKAETARTDFTFDPSNDTIITGYSGTALEVIIPRGVTKIYDNAFINCTSITSIIIPSSVTSIGNNAFSGCTRLIEVFNQSDLEITVESQENGKIGYYAKNVYTTDGSSKLSATEDGYMLYRDGEYVAIVSYTGTATELTIPNYVDEIMSLAFFNRTSLTSVTVPENVISIGAAAFNGCSNIESLTLPFVGGSRKTPTDTYQYPLGYIFGTAEYDGCYSALQTYWRETYNSSTYYSIPAALKSVTVTGGTYILGGAFNNCNRLTSVAFPDSVTSIGVKAFRSCTNLRNVTMPSSLTKIEDEAFSFCYSLTSITIPANVTNIGTNAFNWCCRIVEVYNLSELEITAGTEDNNNKFSPLSINNTNVASKLSTTSDGLVLYTDGDKVAVVGYNGDAKEITIPDGVTDINKFAFYRREDLTSITLASSVTRIGNESFYLCRGLSSFTITENVISIGKQAFGLCSRMINITISAGMPTIEEEAFKGCASLVEVFNKSGLTITAGETSNGYVGYYALNVYTPNTGASRLSTTADGYMYYTDAERLLLLRYLGTALEVTISADVTEIYIGAFNYQYVPALTSITFEDTTSTWYYVYNYSECYNKTGGTEYNVENSSTNATQMMRTQNVCAWYKV